MEDTLTPEQWHELQIRLKLKFPILSDDDLQYHEAEEQDLLKMVGYSLKMNIQNMPGMFIGLIPELPLVSNISN